MINDDVSRLKMCINIKLVGESGILISPFMTDIAIHKGQNPILYICNDGFVFEKSSDTLKYSPSRLTIPVYTERKDREPYSYTFLDNETRYMCLKKLKNHLIEFTSSGYFGKNIYSRILFYDNYWFVY